MNNFSPQSKVWVYQSNREFNTAETEEIKKIGLLFTRDWTAHGSQLNASLDILYNRFIVLMVDENDASASGCSIDKSLAFIKNIEQQFNCVLLDRMAVAYRNGASVLACPLPDFKKLLRENKVDKNTTVFNNMVTTKNDFDLKWETALENSWHKSLLSASQN